MPQRERRRVARRKSPPPEGGDDEDSGAETVIEYESSDGDESDERDEHGMCAVASPATCFSRCKRRWREVWYETMRDLLCGLVIILIILDLDARRTGPLPELSARGPCPPPTGDRTHPLLSQVSHHGAHS